MENEKRLIMNEQEALAKAEQELSLCRHMAECTRNPGMRTIHNNRCAWLSVIVRLAKKTLKVDAVEVVHGRWVHKGAWHIECSECQYILAHIGEAKNYCPNCGAKMDGGNELVERKV